MIFVRLNLGSGLLDSSMNILRDVYDLEVGLVWSGDLNVSLI